MANVCQSSDTEQKNLVLKGKVIIIFTGDCIGIHAQREAALESLPSSRNIRDILVMQNYPSRLKN